MYSTPELITALARRGLLPQADADRFRQLHGDAPADFGPRVLLKWLVNRGRLKVEQADRLAAGIPGRTAEEALKRILGDDDDLQLAPLEDDRDDIPLAEEPMSVDTVEMAAPPWATPRSEAGPKSPSTAASSAPKPRSAEPAGKGTAPRAPAGPLDDLLGELPPSRPMLPKKRKGWDTPLMLVGGGGLIVLVLGGVFLWWRLVRQSGDEAFAAAEEAYGKASYATAVERFDKFLAAHADHPSASMAVVHRGLAKIRIDVEAGDDWNRTLTTAEDVLSEIAKETEFAGSKGDLRALLPEIVRQLARESMEKSDGEKLGKAREAKRLFDRYLADDPQAASGSAELDDLLTLAVRRLERDRKIADAAAAMRAAGERLDATAAFAARDALLAEYPDAATAPSIVEAAAAVTVAAASGVKPIDEKIEALDGERPSPAAVGMTLVRYAKPASGSDTSGNSGSGNAGGDVAVAISGGAALALDAADGRLRWRRQVGFDGRFDPIAFGEGANRSVLLDDSRHGELTAVDAATGRLRWRLPAPGADAWPVVAGDDLLVTLREGKILIIDAETGDSTGGIQFPEELVGGAVADTREQVRYQLARGGRLYVLDMKRRVSSEAVYLGHKADGIRHAPTVVGPYLVLPEEMEMRSRIRLLRGDDAGRNLAEVGSYAAPDHISTSPASARRLMTVVGDRGSVAVFDFTRGEPAEAIKPIVSQGTDDSGEWIRHATMRGGDIWISGQNLEYAVVEAAVGKLTGRRSWIGDGPAMQAPQTVGDRLIAFHDDGAGGLRASAYAAAAREPLWETWLSPARNAGPEISPDGKRLMVIAGNRLYETPVDFSAAGGGAATEAALEPTLELAGLLEQRSIGSPLPGGSAGESAYVLDDPESPPPGDERQIRSLLVIGPPGGERRARVEALAEPAAARPVRFRDGTIVAFAAGRVAYLEKASGKPRAEPFLPPIVVGSRIRWSDAAIVDDGLLIADRDAAFYHLEFREGEPARLAVKREVELPAPIDPGLVVAGELVWYREPPARIVARKISDLGVVEQRVVDAPLVWGPVVAGERVLAASRKDGAVRIHVWDTAGKALGDSILEAGDDGPQGAAAVGGRTYVALRSGSLLRLDPTTGEIAGRTALDGGVLGLIAVEGKLAYLSTSGELVRIEEP